MIPIPVKDVPGESSTYLIYGGIFLECDAFNKGIDDQEVKYTKVYNITWEIIEADCYLTPDLS